VKCKFDRTAVFTDDGNCFIYGGEDLRNIGAEDYSTVWNVKNEIGI